MSKVEFKDTSLAVKDGFDKYKVIIDGSIKYFIKLEYKLFPDVMVTILNLYFRDKEDIEMDLFDYLDIITGFDTLEMDPGEVNEFCYEIRLKKTVN